MRLREIRRELADIEACRQALDRLEARLIAERDMYKPKYKKAELKLVKGKSNMGIVEPDYVVQEWTVDW